MILIVDDKPENVFSLKSTLTLHGFDVDTADSGDAALKKILRTTYSLIILDVQMPGMDGFEVAETVAGYSKAKDTPILFLSAASREKKFITRGYNSGAVDYVTKPVDPDILLLKVKTFHKLSEQRIELLKVQKELNVEIEQRKKAQAELTLRVNELHSVLESLPQIAFVITQDGKIEFVNKLWHQYSKSVDAIPEVHPDDKALYNKWMTALNKGEDFTTEIRMQNVITKEFPYFLLKMIPLGRQDGTHRWVVTLTDIQHQKNQSDILDQMVKERTQQLIDKNEQLELNNHELQQFAWVASHDLKEPLRKIQTINNLIKDRHLASHPEHKAIGDYLNRVIKVSERMSSLIDNLLEYSRLSVQSPYEKTDINVLLGEILSDLELSISEKQARITILNMPVIDAIPSQLRQVFQNLISNAIKFTKKDVPPEINISGERVANLAFESKPSENGSCYRLTVSDNGIGFDEQYLDKIFVLFQRLHGRDTYEGTGIGLAITKKIIEKHGGLITAHSNGVSGSSFIIVLPAIQRTGISAN